MCERSVDGEINCGACIHSWRESNLEDCDEGCELDHDEIFFEAEPGTDCPDWTPRALRSKGGAKDPIPTNTIQKETDHA